MGWLRKVWNKLKAFVNKFLKKIWVVIVVILAIAIITIPLWSGWFIATYGATTFWGSMVGSLAAYGWAVTVPLGLGVGMILSKDVREAVIGGVKNLVQSAIEIVATTVGAIGDSLLSGKVGIYLLGFAAIFLFARNRSA